MFACFFTDRSCDKERKLYLGTFFDIEEATHAFFKSHLSGRENERIFERIFKPVRFRMLLEKAFLTGKLKKTENTISVQLNAGSGVFFRSHKTIKSKRPGDLVRFSLNLFERGEPIATLMIECTRPEFEELCRVVKEEKLKRLELARKEKASKQKQQEAQALGN